MFALSSERCPGYLRIVVTGAGGVDETCAGTVFCAELLRRTSSRRVLIHMLAFVPQFAQVDGLEVLSTLYSGMPPLERIGVVNPAGGSHGLVLDVARHRNVTARDFDGPAEAAAWMQEDLPS